MTMRENLIDNDNDNDNDNENENENESHCHLENLIDNESVQRESH